MKNLFVAFTLGVVISILAAGGCANPQPDEPATDVSTQEDSRGTILGEVKSVGDDTITVEVSGETNEYAVAIDAQIVRQSMGSEPPQKPEGNESQTEVQGGTEQGTPTGQPPEKPEGNESSSGSENGTGQETLTGQLPEKPEGNESAGGSENGTSQDTPTGQPPERPENSGMPGDMGLKEETISLTDISQGDQVQLTCDSDGIVTKITVIPAGGQAPGSGAAQGGNGMTHGSGADQQGSMPGSGAGPNGGGMSSGGVDSYDAVKDITSDTSLEGDVVVSMGKDENAIHVSDGASVSLKNLTVTRDSDDSTGGDNASFYGVGAAILNTEGTTRITDSVIETDAAGAAGVFSYGTGVTYVSDTKIHTSQDASGGIHVAGGGTLYANDLDVVTIGESSAAIRSDRGGGVMQVEGGSYTSNGVGSPAVYSTADITVTDAKLTANGSEAVCIEGLNSLRLYNCDLSGNMADSSQNDCTWNVILYQSMSGDSELGNSTFEMSGGTLTAKGGGMFYTTNTESTFVLSDVDIRYAKDSAFFLRCCGNSNQRGWGKSGANGADCLFTARSQSMQGDIIWDSISELDFYMLDGSSLTGAVVDDESCAGSGGNGYCNLYISSDSVWTVTGDSTLTGLYCEGTIKDTLGKTVTICGTDGTVYVKGSGSCTVTVDTYADTADLSGASK